MIFGWDNTKADAASLSAGSQIETLPGSNVQSQHLSRKWHTAAGVKSSYLLFDMLASVACALLAVLGTNLTPAATLRLRASDADPTAVAGDLLDTGTIAAGVKVGYGAAYKSFTQATARYWRLDLADATVPDNLQIGRVFLGPKWQPAYSQNWGWAVTPLDPSWIDESFGGQEYADQRPQRRQVQFTLDWLTKAEAFDNALTLARANGIVRDVLAIHDVTETYLSEQAVWGRMTALEPILNRHLNVWAQKYTIRERL